MNLPELRGGAGIPGLNRSDVYETHKIPLPPLNVQQEIVAEIEGYQIEIENLNTEIARNEHKIQHTIARVWGEDETLETDVATPSALAT